MVRQACLQAIGCKSRMSVAVTDDHHYSNKPPCTRPVRRVA